MLSSQYLPYGYSIIGIRTTLGRESSIIELKRNFTERNNHFNQTIDEQSNALQYLNLPTKSKDMFSKFGYMCLDGVHAFLPMVNIVWVAIVVLTACMLIWIVMMNGFASDAVMGWEQKIQAARTNADAHISKYAAAYKTPATDKPLCRVADAGINCWHSMLRIANELCMLLVQLVGAAALLVSLFRAQNIGKCFRWLKAGLTDSKDSCTGMSDTYRRMQRRNNILVVVIVAVFFAVCFGNVLRNDRDPSDKQVYLNAAKAVAVDYATDISQTISDILSTGSLTDKEKEQFYALIDMQIEADKTLINYDISKLEDYQELHKGLCSLCEDDIDALQRLRAMIDEGIIPAKEFQKNYVSLRGERYLWVIQKLMSEYVGISAGKIMG